MKTNSMHSKAARKPI